jgi:hypothetical protein
MNLCVNIIQGPARAIVADIVPEEKQQAGNAMVSGVMGTKINIFQFFFFSFSFFSFSLFFFLLQDWLLSQQISLELNSLTILNRIDGYS